MTANSPRLWAAFLPREGVHRTEATAWIAMVNEGGGGQHGIDTFTARAPATSIRFDWFDEALSARGYARTGTWEAGSTDGFRAWIEPLSRIDSDLLELLDQHAHTDD